MTIDWNNLTVWTSLAGGLLIGIAAVLLLMGKGRIAGISGIVAGLLQPARGDIAWRIAFVAGLVVSPLVFALFARVPQARIEASHALLIVAGLLVGIGTRYGAGCTSGHGVCGLARGSRRSLAATAAFMGAGFVTVYIVRHLLA